MTSQLEKSATGLRRHLSSKEVLELEREYLCNGATETDLTFDHGRGSVVVDADGREYTDFASGVLITNIGHAHPRVTEAMNEATRRSPASYNLPTELRATLCERLASALPGALRRSVFFSAGAEAIDASIRLARQVTGKREVLSFRGAFHGRTYMALSVSGKRGLRIGVGDGVPGAIHLPYPDRDGDLDEAAWSAEVNHILASVSGDDVAAILAEPYQGAGGVIIPPAWFLPRLAALADSLGALLIVDEVQSGFGRTGSLFAIDQTTVVPDIVVFGKAMGNGMPIGALATTDSVSEKARYGALSSTFGGNVVACAAAHAVLDAFEYDGVLDQGRALSDAISTALSDFVATVPVVERVRMWGLAIGIELTGAAASASLASSVVKQAREAGLVLIPPIGVFGNVLRVAPALTMEQDQALEGLAILRQILESVPSAVVVSP
jgi:4-aminobutyrate aminotransferase-like enzyme